MARVSPTTSPGRRPAGRGSRTRAADAASPSRSPPAARCRRLESPSSSGGPRAERTATTSSPRSGSEAATRTRACWPGSRPRHSSAAAKSRTGAAIRCSRRPSSMTVTVASATTRPPGSACGSLSSSRTTTAVRCPSAVDRRGELSRAAVRSAAVAAVTVRAASTARTSAVLTVPIRRHPSASATPASATPPRAVGDRAGASRVVPHTVPATGASRRSTHVQRAAVRGVP